MSNSIPTLQQLIFASNNAHKVAEVAQVFPNWFVLKTLQDIHFTDDIPETAPTIEGNAIQKAEFIYERYKLPVFADDTGLEIEALEGRPGVYSARYAGPARSAKDNADKVLHELSSIENRKALFKTVIALKLNDQKPILFEGIIKGTIAYEPKGTQGFGYDPIFIPEGQNLTFAEMGQMQKNAISHRALAVAQLVQYLVQAKQ